MTPLLQLNTVEYISNNGEINTFRVLFEPIFTYQNLIQISAYSMSQVIRKQQYFTDNLSIYLSISLSIYLSIYIYTYLFIYREKEREWREKFNNLFPQCVEIAQFE